MAKKIQYNISALLLLAIILMVPAVSQAAGEEKAETKSKNSTFILTVAKPLIVTTIKPLAIIAKSAVGDAADVTYLLPANQAPHNFSLPVSALNKIAQADLVIWVGADFETRSAKTMAALASSKLITALETEGHNAIAQGKPHQHSMENDPHIWLNSQSGNRLAAEIQSRLGLPIKQIISAEEVTQLRDTLTATMASAQGKTYLTHHDAYGHFAEAFGLPLGLSIRDTSGGAQGAKSQYQLRKNILQANVSCVFVEPQYHNKDAVIIAAEFSLPLIALDPQGQSQPIHGNAYREFIAALVVQFKACFQ